LTILLRFLCQRALEEQFPGEKLKLFMIKADRCLLRELVDHLLFRFSIPKGPTDLEPNRSIFHPILQSLLQIETG
jgi:hypothetical protein